MPPPPKDPPVVPADKKSVSDNWDDALGDRAQQTVSPEMVRKLLEMNPALREAGMSTNITVDQVQRAHQKAASAPIASAKKPASVGLGGTPGGSDIVGAFADFKHKLVAEQKRIDDEIAKLKKLRDEASAHTHQRVVQWLLANDADMRSPVTQTVLEKEKSFLDQVGFSVKRYVESRMKK